MDDISDVCGPASRSEVVGFVDQRSSDRETRARGILAAPPAPRPAPALFTAVLADECGGGTVQAFAAMVACHPEELEFSLSCRFGPATAAAAEISRGVDWSHPLVEALVPPAMADMLSQVAETPGSPLAAGLEVVVEQRFLA